MTRSRVLVSVLGLGLSAVAVVALLRQTDVREMWANLRAARLGWLLVAGAVTLAGYVLRARRWGVILEPRVRVRQGRLVSATLIGFLAINTLPARLGELVRAYVLSRTERIPVGAVLGSVVMERLFDLVALGSFWALSLLFAPYPAWFRWSGYLTLALGLSLVSGLWFLHAAHAREHPARDRLLAILPAAIRDSVAGAISSFTGGLSGLRQPWLLARAAAWSLAMWLLNGAVFLLVGMSLGIALPWWSPFLLAFVVSVAILLPSSPGFIGVLEASCVVGLGLLGVRESPALAFGILYHLTQLVPLVLAGAFLAVRGQLGAGALTEGGAGVTEPGLVAGGKKRRH